MENREQFVYLAVSLEIQLNSIRLAFSFPFSLEIDLPRYIANIISVTRESQLRSILPGNSRLTH